MVFGVGAFAQSVTHILKEQHAEVSTYLTRKNAHYGPALEGATYSSDRHPNPCPLLREKQVDLVVPMSIDWALQEWTDEFLALGIPILSPTGEGMKLERDRDFARNLCKPFGIPFPKSFVARNRLEAEKMLDRDPRAYVIKNALCSPESPVHTIVCESAEDTRSWLKKVNYAEGVFLQEYMGRNEAGHIAFISAGEIYSLITNQEYKRAYDGNLGIVAGAPLGGIVEKDPRDKYHFAEQLLQPLLPWFRQVNFHGPVQVTAACNNGRWSVLEYNVRIGVTCGAIILRMLNDPLKVISDVSLNRKLEIVFKEDLNFGCSLTLAGLGYPFPEVNAPQLPVQLTGDVDGDLWWNEVMADSMGNVQTDGQRIADLVGIKPTLDAAIEAAYRDIRKLRCLGSYYRTDIGQSLWPPGSD